MLRQDGSSLTRFRGMTHFGDQVTQEYPYQILLNIDDEWEETSP